MSALDDNTDVAVLGGGPGGYVAALRAAQRGARVVLIEKERVGGTCLNVGCIPTKVLTSVTELLVRAKRAGEFGLAIPEATVDLPALMAYKGSTVGQLVGGVEQLLKARRITLIRGAAHLIKPDALSMQITRLSELYAETNQTGYIIRHETDGMPTWQDAYMRLKMA